MSKNKAAQPIPAELTGIVTRIAFTLSGAQDAALDVYAAGTEAARLVLRWGKLHMTFTSCAQVQYLRGYFADTRRAMLGSVDLATLPILDADPTEAAMVAAITWSQTPEATISAHQMPIPRLRRTITYAQLSLGTVSFRILDKAALDSAIELLGRAHQLAIVAFPDGPQYRENPTTATWRARAGIKQRGRGIVPR